MILASRRVVASFVAAFCGLAIVAAVNCPASVIPNAIISSVEVECLAGMPNCFMGYARSNVQAATYAGLSVFMIALPGWDVSIK
jgi:hypothetical protein